MAHFIERLERGDRPTVMALGDSLTFGYMVPRGYLHILRDRLTLRRPTAPPIVDNQGACGDTAAGGRARLRHLLEDGGPDLALIQFGINDAFLGISCAAYRRDLDALITTFREARPDGEVIVVPPPPVAWDEDDATLEPYRAAAAAAAAAQGVGHAPVSGLFHRNQAGAYLADGVHPAEKGHAWMAEAVLAALDAV
ncbi:MAG: SGNH/GDSL hydrolase family protein [Pseudomonadota bacterium]